MSDSRSQRQILEATSVELGNVNKILQKDTQLFLDICKSKRDNFDEVICFRDSSSYSKYQNQALSCQTG